MTSMKVKELLDILLQTWKMDTLEILITSENMLSVHSEFMELKETTILKVFSYGEELKFLSKLVTINQATTTSTPSLITLKNKIENI